MSSLLNKTVRGLAEDGHDHANEGGHDDHEEGLSVTGFKIIMLFCMILCVGLGLIPKFWSKCQKSETTLSFLNCFSAGIFLAMSLVHMMPESAEVYQMWAAKEGIERPFPLPYVGFFLGYVFILGIDRVAAKAYHMDHGHDEKKDVSINADTLNKSMKQQDRDTEMKAIESGSARGKAIGTIVSNNISETKVGSETGGEQVTTVSKTAAIILVLALGAHAFFEGIAFGLTPEISSAG